MASKMFQLVKQLLNQLQSGLNAARRVPELDRGLSNPRNLLDVILGKKMVPLRMDAEKVHRLINLINLQRIFFHVPNLS